jgi:hypothetical protein
MFMDELHEMAPAVDRNCLSHDIAIERAKNQLKQLVSSPNTQLVNEYTALIRKEFAAIEEFIYENKISHQDMGELYDALKAKYGIDPTTELSSYVSDKLHIIVEAGRELNTCPCCVGAKRHTIPERISADSNKLYDEETYDCETCGGTGKLA